MSSESNFFEFSRDVYGFFHSTNAYGGGVSVMVGAYYFLVLVFDSTTRTTIIGSSIIVSINNITSCTALSSTSASGPKMVSDFYGSTSYGGGVSIVVGAYAYFRFATKSVDDSTAVSSSSVAVSAHPRAGRRWHADPTAQLFHDLLRRGG